MINTQSKKQRRKLFLRSTVSVLAAIAVFVTTYALIIPAITMEETLICSLEEHTHDDSCYKDGVLICKKEEHAHTASCYDAPKNDQLYICGKTEHQHNENCYFEEGTLKCTIEIHTHTSACLNKTLLLTSLLGAVPGDDTNTITKTADPSTKDIIQQFQDSNGHYTAANDGKVAVDKTVEVNSNTDKDIFDITLSALGQSYNDVIAEETIIHPDVVFVVDLSSSMVINTMNGTTDKRLKGVADALNNAIGELIKNDPETRIGVVSYGQYVLDGTDEHNERLHLPLDKYRTLSNGNYVQYIDNGSNSATIEFNTSWRTQSGSYVADTAATVSNSYYGTGADYAGTYTSGGLFAGMQMLVDAAEDKREPVMILISDGLPNYYNTFTVDSITGELETISSRQGSASTGSVPKADYWTIRAAIIVKEQVHIAYSEAQESTEDIGMLLYSLGPGVSSLEGMTVLSPGNEYENSGKTNLEACKTGNSYEQTLHTYLTEGNGDDMPPLSQNEWEYVDFADWSLAGDMTPEALQEGMRQIVKSIKNIPRPIISTTKIDVPKDMIDTESYMTFSDTLGKGMVITKDTLPILHYNGIAKQPASTTSGTISEGLYKGYNYVLYEYAGKVTERSTGHVVDLKEVRFFVITKDDGTQVIEWQFPADFMPIIYHDYGEDAEDPSDDEFYTTEPIRVTFNVSVNGITESGVLYKTNSTEDAAWARFKLTDDNPYAAGDGFSATYSKAENTTNTASYVAAYSKDYSTSGKCVDVLLGNNGILRNNLLEIEVEKVWADGSPSQADVPGLTVSLYADGVLNDTAILTSTNGWKASFGRKQAFDSAGDPIIYTVEEETLAKYYLASSVKQTAYRSEERVIKESETIPEHWSEIDGEPSYTQINALESGKVYRLVSEGKALQITGTTSTSASNLTLATMSETNANQRFTLTKSNSGNTWTLINGNDRAIQYNSSSFHPNSSSNATSFSITTAGLIKRSNNNTYLRVGATNNSTTSTSNATAFKFQELIPKTTIPAVKGTIDITVSMFTLTNKELPDSLPAEKIWGYRTEDLKRPVVLSLYEKDGTTVTKIGELKLNAENDWRGDMDLTDCDNRKTYYVAEEENEEFQIGYPGAVEEKISYNGQNFRALRIVFGSTEVLTVKNEVLQILPSTGGKGAAIIQTIGILLMSSVLIVGFVLSNKHKRSIR